MTVYTCIELILLLVGVLFVEIDSYFYIYFHVASFYWKSYWQIRNPHIPLNLFMINRVAYVAAYTSFQ
jgi:hypothetical protein